MSFSAFESQLHRTLQTFSVDLIEQFIVGYALTLSKTCPFFTCLQYMSFKYHIRNCCLQTLSVWKSLKFVVWGRVNYNIHTSRLCPWVYLRRVCHMDISHFRLPDCATDKKYSSLIGRSRNSSLKRNSTYSIQWLTLRQEFTYMSI